MPLTVGTLYTGIGGSDLGFERAGLRIVFQAEIDPWRLRVLERRFPDARRWYSAYAALAEEAVVDVLYAAPPNRDAAWLDPLWERAAKYRSRAVVIEGPVGASGEAARQIACARIGYDYGTFGVSAEWGAPWGHFGKSMTFTLCWPCEHPPLVLANGLTDQLVDPGESLPAYVASVTELFEATLGLPAGWGCACGAVNAGLCAETSARLVAANECCPPGITQWLGARLSRALAIPSGLGAPSSLVDTEVR